MQIFIKWKIHKGGSKLLKQYRPESLMSHVIKVSERVIKKYILKHLTNSNHINEGQLGFVPCKSIETQPLAHYNNIHEKNEDVHYFLDYAKAFDNFLSYLIASPVLMR